MVKRVLGEHLLTLKWDFLQKAWVSIRTCQNRTNDVEESHLPHERKTAHQHTRPYQTCSGIIVDLRVNRRALVGKLCTKRSTLTKKNLFIMKERRRYFSEEAVPRREGNAACDEEKEPRKKRGVGRGTGRVR